MKKLGLLSVAVAILFGATVVHTQPSNPVHNHVDVVTLWVSLNSSGYGLNGYQYDGAVVYDSSSSSGAPVFPQQGSGQPLIQVSQALSKLLSEGFEIVHVEDSQLSFTLTRHQSSVLR